MRRLGFTFAIVLGLGVLSITVTTAQPRDMFRGPWVVTQDSTVATNVGDTTMQRLLMYGDTIFVHSRKSADLYISQIDNVDWYVPSAVLVMPSRFMAKTTTKKAGGPEPRRDVTLRLGATAGTALWLDGAPSMDPEFSYAFSIDIALSGANVYATASYEKVQHSFIEHVGWLGWPQGPDSSFTVTVTHHMASLGLHVGFVAQPVDFVPYIHPIAGWVFREYDPFFVAGLGLGADYYITGAIVATAEVAPYMKFDRWGRDWWILPIRAGLKVAL